MFAYFDCFSGISGDMTLGAFIDLGVPDKWLNESLCKIPLTGVELTVERVSRNGISAVSVNVHTGNNKESKDYAEIKSLIENSRLSVRVRQISLDVFAKIAVAEAAIHGCPVEKVHFHEVGCVDSIVDIAGTALCVEYLGIKKITASKLSLGRGFVNCRHGILPVPAPATLEILKGVPVIGTEIAHELVTPTGAAIIAVLADSFEAIPDMIVNKTGYGAGKREIESVPNLLRIITGTAANQWSDFQHDIITVVETVIDDMNPEIFGFVMDRLFEDGALDVYLVPVFMKKNRPGTKMQVLCPRAKKKAIIHRILFETTSSGLRHYDVQRTKLHRKSTNVQTSYGIVRVKSITQPDGSVSFTPEYEVCKKIALAKNIPVRVVYDTIIKVT